MRATTIENKVKKAAQELGGFYRKSRRGVPLVVMMDAFGDGVNYSVCYFATTNVWRIFKGYRDFNNELERITVPRFIDVQKYFNNQPYNTIEVRPCEDDGCTRYVKDPNTSCKWHGKEE